jgi:hypothetical protein
MIQKFVKIVLILGMVAVLCSTVSAAGMGIVAETHETSGVNAPVCSAPCECISLTEAMQRWGADGYDYCGKTVCGQSADAMVQYYCLHQIASPAPAVTLAQATVQVPAAAAPAAPAAAVPTQKSPVSPAAILAALGISVLAAAMLRRK